MSANCIKVHAIEASKELLTFVRKNFVQRLSLSSFRSARPGSS